MCCCTVAFVTLHRDCWHHRSSPRASGISVRRDPPVGWASNRACPCACHRLRCAARRVPLSPKPAKSNHSLAFAPCLWNPRCATGAGRACATPRHAASRVLQLFSSSRFMSSQPNNQVYCSGLLIGARETCGTCVETGTIDAFGLGVGMCAYARACACARSVHYISLSLSLTHTYR